jgi:transposase-like protein
VLRWHETDGEPVCPACGCVACYEYRARRLFKCQACGRQFSVTSGTTFHSRKLPVRDYLMAIAIFVNAAKGISALQLGCDLDVSYKTAFVLAHKLREAMAADQASYRPQGHVEVDGCHVGGHVRQENYKSERKDRRLSENQSGKRRVVVVVVMRERQGRTLPFGVRAEDEASPIVAKRVLPGSTVYADEASHWDALHARFETHRINHGFAFSDDGACTNKPSRSSRGCAGPSTASTTASRAPTCRSTPARWRGARTCGARTPGRSTSGAAATPCTTPRAGTGAGTGSGTRHER